MQEIENFNTGSASNPNANNININPSENDDFEAKIERKLTYTEIKNNFIATETIELVDRYLKKKEQVLFFINRRDQI